MQGSVDASSGLKPRIGLESHGENGSSKGSAVSDRAEYVNKCLHISDLKTLGMCLSPDETHYVVCPGWHEKCCVRRRRSSVMETG